MDKCLFCDGYYLHQTEGFCLYFDEYIADLPKDEIADCTHVVGLPVLRVVTLPVRTPIHIIT